MEVILDGVRMYIVGERRGRRWARERAGMGGKSVCVFHLADDARLYISLLSIYGMEERVMCDLSERQNRIP